MRRHAGAFDFYRNSLAALNAEVIIRQVGKISMVQFYAKSIMVHQDTKVTRVSFLHETVNAVIVT